MNPVPNPKPYLYIDDLLSMVKDVPDNSIISQTIHKDRDTKVILFGFAAGQSLSEHTAAQDAILHFLTGEATVTLGENRYEARPGTWIRMAARFPHSVVAKTPVTMLLIMLHSRDT